VFSHSILQINGDPDIYSRLLLNDVNPPVVHETSKQQTYNGQDSVTTVETLSFSLRNLPFGFLSWHILCRSSSHMVGGILASSPAIEETANKKAHTIVRASVFAGSPGRTRTCNLCAIRRDIP
jgi:hypothetical protein